MKIKNLIPWIARGLSVIITLGTYAFVFELSPKDFEWSSIFLAAIPGTILLIVTAVAWNFPKPGGLIYILLGLLYAVLGWYRVSFVAIGVLSGALILAGLTFIFGKKEDEEKKIVKDIKLERVDEKGAVTTTVPTTPVLPNLVKQVSVPSVPEVKSTAIQPLPTVDTTKPVMANLPSMPAQATPMPLADAFQTNKVLDLDKTEPEVEETSDEIDMPTILPAKLPELMKQTEIPVKEELEESFASLQSTPTPTVSTMPIKETIGTPVGNETKTLDKKLNANVFTDLLKKDEEKPVIEKNEDIPDLFAGGDEITIPGEENITDTLLKSDQDDVLPVFEPSVPSTTQTAITSDDQVAANQPLPDWLAGGQQSQTVTPVQDDTKTDIMTEQPEIEIEEPSIEGFEDSVLVPLDDRDKSEEKPDVKVTKTENLTIPAITLTSANKGTTFEEPSKSEAARSSTTVPTPPAQVATPAITNSTAATKPNDTFMDWFKPEEMQNGKAEE